MASSYTSLLGLALPVTGELSGSWGDVVNDSITSLLDSAVAGTTTLSTDGDVTLSTTTGASNQARQAILLCSGARTALRTITAPAQSKIYTVINATTGGYSVKVVGVGPTTGVTIVAGESAVIAWNGSDFIKVSNTGGSASFTNVTVSGTTTLSGLTASTALALNSSKEVVSVTNTGTGNNVLSASPTLTGTVAGASLQLSTLTSGRVTYAGASGLLQDSANLTFNGTDLTVSGAVNAGTINATTLDLTNLEVTNIKAKDGTAGMQIADSTGVVSFTANPVMSGGTANGVAYLNGSKVLTTGSALVFDGTNLGIGTSSPSVKLHVIGTSIVGAAGTPGFTSYKSTGVPDGFDIGLLGGDASANGFIYNRNNGAVVFGTNGTERMRLSAAGGLSIGTTTDAGAGGLITTGNVTLGDASTDTVQVNGYMGVGGAAATNRAVSVVNTALSGTTQSGVVANITGTSGATTGVNGLAAEVGTAAAVFTAADVTGLIVQNAFKGAGSTITNQHGVRIVDQTQGTNNYGITSVVSSGTNKWNIYASGTAQNYFAGNVGIGATPNTWFTGYRVVDFGTSSLAANGGNTEIGLQSNNYRDAAANFIYKTTAAAARYSISAGQHTWWNAPSGTAGDTITFTQAMTLSASGNLGIGTSLPTQKLHIAGSSASNIYGRWSNGTQELYAGINSSNIPLIGTLSNDPLAFFSNSTERMRIDSSGNVGIGTTSPQAYLQVGSGSITPALTTGATIQHPYTPALSLLAPSATAATARVTFGTEVSTQAAGLTYTNSTGILQIASTGGSTNGNITFQSAGGEQMRLTSTGLGIGTSSPTNTLSVTGTANVTGNVTLGDASTDTVTVNGYMGVGGAPSSATGLYIRSVSLTGAAQAGVFSWPRGTSDATSAVDAFYGRPETAAGSYTTGRVSGLVLLDAVKGAGSTITTQYGIWVLDQTQGVTNFGINTAVSSGANKWNIYASGTAANYFAGNVGIGTTTPANQLTVSAAASAIIQALVTNAANPSIFRAQNSAGVTFDFRMNGPSAATNASTALINTSGSQPIAFIQSGVESMRINSSNNLGIGTSSPGARLEVSASGSTTKGGEILIANSAARAIGNYSQLGFKPNSDYTGAVVGAFIRAIDTTGDVGNRCELVFGNGQGGTPTESMRIDNSGNVQISKGAVVVYAPGPASISTTATLTNANIQSQIINTTGTSYTVTMPLGTTMETLVIWATTNLGYDFTVINTASGTITMAVNTGVTSLGALTIATGTSAQFRIRRTAADTFILYRMS